MLRISQSFSKLQSENRNSVFQYGMRLLSDSSSNEEKKLAVEKEKLALEREKFVFEQEKFNFIKHDSENKLNLDR